MVTTIALTAIWLWVGAGGFLYWWRRTEKFKGTPGEIDLLFVASIFGPLTFIACWMVDKTANK